MFSGWRIFAAGHRCWLVRALLVVLALLPVSSTAFADVEAQLTNAAAGRSQTNAVEQAEKDVIDREVMGASGGGGTLGPGVFASGGLRTSDHDALNTRILVPSGDAELDAEAKEGAFSYETEEASAFASAFMTVPGTVLGGQLKLNGFVGYNWLSLDVKSNAETILVLNQDGSARNDSVLVGGTALWASQGMYALASIVGTWGETRLTDSIDDCGYSYGCNVHHFKYDTAGFVGNLTAGKVFTISAAGPMLDLRGSVGYTRHDGDRFLNNFGDAYDTEFSTWTGKAGATLFTNSVLENGAVLRPYLQGYLRQEWDYDNEVDLVRNGDLARVVASYDQDHFHGGFDAGVTYNLDHMTLSAATYSEWSGDERTLGARVGASWLLGGGGTQRQSAEATPTPPLTWTGFYLGAHAGFASADIGMTNLGPDAFFAPVGGSDTISAEEWLAGGQVGYNLQVGTMVAGVEGLLSTGPVKEDRESKFFDDETWIAGVSELYAITGRLGIASGSWMPYVKGGFAGANITTSMTAQAEPSFISQSENWHLGWTGGGGIEYMLGQNWTVGVEYDFYDFESKDVSAIRTHDLATDHWTVTPDNLQTISGRMNYKFN